MGISILCMSCLGDGDHPEAIADAADLMQGLTVCLSSADCLQDEACTQGGHCVNTTGERSATAALQADFNSLPDAVGLGVPYDLPPNARLLIDDIDGDGVGLRIQKKILLNGNGAALMIDNDIVGLRVEGPSQWSSLRDLSFVSTNFSQVHDGVGLDVRSHGLRLDNLFFNRMGTGIRAFSNLDGVHANNNIQQWSRIVFNRCHQYAVHLRGGDVNAGLFTGLEVIAGNGIRDNSFLGNTYVAPVFNSTSEDSLTIANNAASSTVLGVYAETNAPWMRSASFHDLHVGGNAIDRLESPGDRIGRHAASIRFRHESGFRVRIPGAAHAPMAFNDPIENEWWFFRYFPHPSWRLWAFSHRNQGHHTVYRFTGSDHEEGPGKYHLGEPMNSPDSSDDSNDSNGGGPPPHARARQNRDQEATTFPPNEPEEYFQEPLEPDHDIGPAQEEIYFWEGMDID